MEERTKPRLFDSDSELEALLAAFDEARIPRHLWTHREHLAVATLYVLQQRGLDAIRTGIQRLNEANGVPQTPTGGYHETITRAYAHLIADFLSEQREGTLAQRVGVLLASPLAHKNALLEYYSKELLMSVAARGEWSGPDLKPLTGGPVTQPS